MMDFITGEKFIALADNVNVFYCNTHDVPYFLQHIPKNPYVMITHNSDHKINIGYRIPSNCIHWFAQNVNIVNERIESIPIGLENSKWFKEVRKKDKMSCMLQQPKTYKNLVYMNHNVDTNPEQRSKPYRILQDKSWVTVERGYNGHGFDEYLRDIYTHRFVVCPEGNGIDTHRTWETLYMGSVPIEKRNINNQFYTDLPICFVNDWAEVTEDFLENEYYRIKSNAWNMDKLKFEYWKNKIYGRYHM